MRRVGRELEGGGAAESRGRKRSAERGGMGGSVGRRPLQR